MAIDIRPVPASYRAIPAKWRPMIRPIFPDGKPSRADLELAVALIEALDGESRIWYAGALASLKTCLAESRF